MPGVRVKLRSRNSVRPPSSLEMLVHGDQALGAAVGGGEIDLRGALDGARFQVGEFAHQAAGVVDARLGFAGARLGAAAQPLHLAPHAVGQRLLAVGLREQELLLLFQEVAVAALDAEDAVGIGAIDLGHVVDHVVEEVAVVADHHAGEGRVGEQLLEPEDAFEIQVVGGLVEEEQVGLADQFAGDGEAALPAAGERFGAQAAIGEAGAAQRLVDARGAFQIVEVLAGDGVGDDLVDGVALGEFGVLRHVADARVAAHGDGAGIGLELAGEDPEQGGLARAVAADQAEALAFGDAERDVLEQQAGAEGFGEAGTAFEERH